MILLRKLAEIADRLVLCRDCRWYREDDGCFFSTAECEPEHFCSWEGKVEE